MNRRPSIRQCTNAHLYIIQHVERDECTVAYIKQVKVKQPFLLPAPRLVQKGIVPFSSHSLPRYLSFMYVTLSNSSPLTPPRREIRRLRRLWQWILPHHQVLTKLLAALFHMLTAVWGNYPQSFFNPLFIIARPAVFPASHV